MVLLLHANSFLYGIGINILACAVLWLVLRLLLARDGKKLLRRGNTGGSNRDQRRKEQAMSRQKRR